MERKDVLFTHIPKTGGTTIKAIFKGRITLFRDHMHITKDNIDQYRHYYKFTFVRNPWQRLASMYRVNELKVNKLSDFKMFPYHSFRHYVESLTESNHPMRDNQLDFISVDGQVEIDFIGRFENYSHDFYTLCDNIGINATLDRKLRYHGEYNYLDYYKDDELVKLVGEYYSKDVEYFCYKFGE